MEEAVKALAPWPVLQGVIIGLIVAGVGFWAIRRGLQESRRQAVDDVPQLVRFDPDAPPVKVQHEFPIDEHKARWQAFEQLHHLQENSFRQVRLLEDLIAVQIRLTEAINRFNDVRWNKTQ